LEPAVSRPQNEGNLSRGWLFYRRVKTGKSFYRSMNRIVHAQTCKRIIPGNPPLDDPMFLGGSARPNVRFQELCEIAGIKPRKNVETCKDEAWQLKDLRKTCATYYNAQVPESSIDRDPWARGWQHHLSPLRAPGALDA
jgi:hypothetical protein